MNTKLEEAIELIQASMSQMEGLHKELDETRAELVKKSQLLDKEVANNILLNEELERLREKVAQLDKPLKLKPKIAPNRVTEVMNRRAQMLSEPSADLKKKEVAEKEPSDRFSLIDVPLAYRSVISKTSHLHHFLLSKINVKIPRLRLWLNDSEVDDYYEAKQTLLTLEIQRSDVSSTNVIGSSTQEIIPCYVTKGTRLCDVELPHFLVDIGKLTLDTFGSNVLISEVLEIDDNARNRFSVPVAFTLPALKSHLKKRIKQRSSLNLQSSVRLKETCSDQGVVTGDHAEEAHHDLLGELSQYTTQKGKVLNGWFVDVLSEREVKEIDPYTIKVNGQFFVRERHRDLLLAAIRSLQCLSNDTARVTQEEGDFILVLLNNEFTFSNTKMASESVLFDFDESTPKKILINTAHPYVQQASLLSTDFWNSIRTFIALWWLLKKMNLRDEAREQIALTRAQLMRTLATYTKTMSTPSYAVQSLSSNVLFDITSLPSGLLVRLNEKHPFNEHYLMPLEEHEREMFIKIYAAWLSAEKETLSHRTELSLQTTRQLVGTEFYHLVDEIQHGND